MSRALGWTPARFRQIMWNHGFAPVAGSDEQQWLCSDFKQMIDERVRWGFLVVDGASYLTELQASQKPKRVPVEPYEAPKPVAAPVDRWGFDEAKYQAHEALNRRLRTQLADAPVLARDLDYLASRAGERRPRRNRGVGPTEMILKKTQHKNGSR